MPVPPVSTERDPGEPESPRPRTRSVEHRFGVLLTVAYDGRRFSGWARQTNARSVEGELSGAIAAIDPKASQTRGLSRTDAGVHAREQLVAFDTDKDIGLRGWVLALSQNLPDEIAIVRATRVPPGFDARRQVTRKVYRYTVLQSRVRDPFLEGRAWRVIERFNHSDLNDIAQSLVGKHDFAAFRGAADTRTETVRQIFRIEVQKAHSDERITWIEVEGDKFLYNMVRIIVGALIDIGRGRLPEDALTRALASHARTDLGITAPADGLCLERVIIDDATLVGGTSFPELESWPPAH
ncbi:MAG TPA: tRNA pseudouridine(38-40) synthase TruA [Polyangiaceae bacterium]|nr:tRNA pseudouridine(38-40) synthase TruA [Polyangiaceae bacterium]